MVYEVYECVEGLRHSEPFAAAGSLRGALDAAAGEGRRRGVGALRHVGGRAASVVVVFSGAAFEQRYELQENQTSSGETESVAIFAAPSIDPVDDRAGGSSIFSTTGTDLGEASDRDAVGSKLADHLRAHLLACIHELTATSARRLSGSAPVSTSDLFDEAARWVLGADSDFDAFRRQMADIEAGGWLDWPTDVAKQIFPVWRVATGSHIYEITADPLAHLRTALGPPLAPRHGTGAVAEAAATRLVL